MTVRERPILLDGVMVRAILAGQKTQTRRVAKNVVAAHAMTGEALAEIDSAGPRVRCPFGQPGDRLWVREAFGFEVRHYGGGAGEHIVYRATNPDAFYCRSACGKEYPVKWRPSTHMPRHSSRLLLEITAVRVERLQAISDDDCFHEGLPIQPRMRAAFRELWNLTSGAWDIDPWVWVIEFKRVEATA